MGEGLRVAALVPYLCDVILLSGDLTGEADDLFNEL